MSSNFRLFSRYAFGHKQLATKYPVSYVAPIYSNTIYYA